MYKIPKTLKREEASLVEPMACAIHAVQRGNIEFEDVVVMAGAGTLGLCMVQLIKLKTPKKLIVPDINEMRLEKAKKFGADICINPKKEDAVKIVKELTHGYSGAMYILKRPNPPLVCCKAWKWLENSDALSSLVSLVRRQRRIVSTNRGSQRTGFARLSSWTVYLSGRHRPF